MGDTIRIANCSGYYGDRLDAAREMVTGGPIDVLTGDYLAELTMKILYDQREQRGAHMGYVCLLYTSPSPRDLSTSRMPSSA